MKELIEHFRDEMLIAQVIYEFNVNVNCRFCFRYFIDDQIWLNVKNFNIVRFIVKFDDHQMNLFQIKRVFNKNSLIIELKFSKLWKFISSFTLLFLIMWSTTFCLINVKNLASSSLLRMTNVLNMWIVFSISKLIDVIIRLFFNIMSIEKIISRFENFFIL